MVSVAGDRYIVIQVQTQACHERFRSVLLALIGELLWAFAKISVKDTLQSHFPLRGNFLCITLGNSLHVRFQLSEELIEVVQRVTIKCTRSRHRILWADTIVLHAVKRIIAAATLAKLAVTVQANYLDSTVHISLVSYKTFAEIISLTCLLQYFTFKERQSREVPTRTALVLVFDTGDFVLLNCSKHRLILFDSRVFLLYCACSQCEYSNESQGHHFFHSCCSLFKIYIISIICFVP